MYASLISPFSSLLLCNIEISKFTTQNFVDVSLFNFSIFLADCRFFNHQYSRENYGANFMKCFLFYFAFFLAGCHFFNKFSCGSYGANLFKCSFLEIHDCPSHLSKEKCIVTKISAQTFLCSLLHFCDFPCLLSLCKQQFDIAKIYKANCCRCFLIQFRYFPCRLPHFLKTFSSEKYCAKFLNDCLLNYGSFHACCHFVIYKIEKSRIFTT